MDANAVINGNFDVWQHGLTVAIEGYSASRWRNTLAGAATQTVSRQSFVLGQTEVPNNPIYHARLTAVGAGGASDISRIENRIEGVQTFAGSVVTLAFWAKRFSGVGDLRVHLIQNFGSGGAPSAAVVLSQLTAVLTTAWQRFAFQFEVPGVTGMTLGTNENSSYLNVLFSTNDGTGFNQTIEVDIAQVQLIAGYGPIPYAVRRTDEELTLCQRYFRKSLPPDVVLAAAAGIGTGELVFPATAAGATLQRSPTVRFGKSMRAIPTIAFYNPVAGTGPAQAYDNTAAAPLTGTAAVNISRDGFAVTAIGAAGTAIGNDLRVHWRANAEL